MRAFAWLTILDTPSDRSSRGFSVAYDADGNVFAGGHYFAPVGFEYGTFLIVKYAASDGHELWRALPSSSSGQFDGVYRLRLGEGGRLFAAGTSGYQALVVAIDAASGAEL